MNSMWQRLPRWPVYSPTDATFPLLKTHLKDKGDATRNVEKIQKIHAHNCYYNTTVTNWPTEELLSTLKYKNGKKKKSNSVYCYGMFSRMFFLIFCLLWDQMNLLNDSNLSPLLAYSLTSFNYFVMLLVPLGLRVYVFNLSQITFKWP